jgi:hypothetical protein
MELRSTELTGEAAALLGKVDRDDLGAAGETAEQRRGQADRAAALDHDPL